MKLMAGVESRWGNWAWRFGPPVIWMVIISSVSTDSFSTEHTSRYIEPLLRWLLPGATAATIELLHTGLRKTAHLTEYGALALLWYRSLRQPGHGWHLRGALQAFAIVVAWALVDEFHQLFVPSRGASLADVGLDSLGAALGLAVGGVIQRMRPVIGNRIKPNRGGGGHA
jgi:VanZ family protein